MSENETFSCRPAPEDLSIMVLVYCFQGFYGFLSLFVYILNIKALRFYRKVLDKTFSLFYICSAVLSIVYFLDYYLIRRFLKLGFFCEYILENFSEPTFFMNPYKTISSYCPIGILVFHFLIALHRFTIVAEPMRGVQVWEDHRKLAAILGFLIPLIFMWFMIPTKSYAQLDEDGGGGLDIEYKKVFNISSSFFACIAAVSFGLLTFILTLGMLVTLLKVNYKKMSSGEASLIVFEVLMTIFTMIYACIQGLVYYFNYVDKNSEMEGVVKWIKQNFVVDIFILPQAWTLLFLSKTVREYTLRFFGKKIGDKKNLSASNRSQIMKVSSSASRIVKQNDT